MLPTLTDNGARLAAILPTAIAAMDTKSGLATEIGVRQLRSVVLVVVDGLGYSNLKASAGHARTLASLPTKRIETVIPSTTGAALTTLTTGKLPGEHGLVGYKIRHPELGLITTLKDWQGIEDVRAWQRAEPLFWQAKRIGARAVAIGRAAHATGGLTEAILGGAEYLPGQTIADRFSVASRLLRDEGQALVYLYIDELDKVAHSDGWSSDLWLRRLEQFDAALADFLRGLPGDVGVIVTADHGIVDVPYERRLMLDDGSIDLSGVESIGGEPRMRSLYLNPTTDAADLADRLQKRLGKVAWVGTRESAITAGWFGPIESEVADRLGEVLVVARGMHAFNLQTDPSSAHEMVGQHGGISDEERGVPLALAGSLAGSSFVSLVGKIALNER